MHQQLSSRSDCSVVRKGDTWMSMVLEDYWSQSMVHVCDNGLDQNRKRKSSTPNSSTLSIRRSCKQER